MNSSGLNDREFENLVREGITAARGGRRVLARRLFERAIAQKPTDARVWLWLSATTDDVVEQRNFLEKAVAADPYNAAAKRGLAILAKNHGSPVQNLVQQAHEDGFVAPEEGLLDPARTYRANTQTFDCPECGGGMHHKASENLLACESCGHAITTNEDFTADSAETPFGPLLQSGRAHVWAASAHDIVCEQCGAHSLEPPGNKTQVCPYCGSNQLVESAQLSELIDPQVIGLFELEQDEAQRIVQSWLQEGFFTPDKMSNEAKKLELRPAYFPFWTFDGSVEVNWSAEVRENYTRGMYDNPEWQLVSGTETEFFDDVLVPGMTAMKFAELRRILPFKLKDVVRFEPAHLAGWNAMAYDRAISDASLLAREIVIRRLRPKMRGMIEQRKEKRNVSVGAGRWTGLSFKLAYLPIWVGTFKNGNDLVRVLVNGQTGKVGGKKPRDQVKVVGTWLIGLLFVILILIILFGFLTASLDTTRI